jgi:hypothetical protein
MRREGRQAMTNEVPEADTGAIEELLDGLDAAIRGIEEESPERERLDAPETERALEELTRRMRHKEGSKWSKKR